MALIPRHDLRSALNALNWGGEKESERRLADKTMIHVSLIRRYLRGETEVGKDNARALAAALGISVEAALYRASDQHAA